VQVCGPGGARLERVAVWGGSSPAVAAAGRLGADGLVTGEMSYHDAEIAAHYNLGVIRLGHGVSERVVLAPLAKALRRALPGVKVMLSRDPAAPLRNV